MDLLNWFYMADTTSHLEGNANPVYSTFWPENSAGQGKVIWIKNGQGFPWDVMTYDNSYFYLWATESGPTSWTDASYYKAFQTPVPLVERFINAGLPSTPLVTYPPNTNVVTYAGCQPSTPVSLGRIRTQATGPWLLDHGGTVGRQPTVVLSYQWNSDNSKYLTREQFYLVENIGLVRWDRGVLQPDGTYLVAPDADFPVNPVFYNTLKPGGCPNIVFPC